MSSIKLALNLRLAIIQFSVLSVFSVATYTFVKSKLEAGFDQNLLTLSQAAAGVVEMEYEDGGLEIELESDRAPVVNFSTTVYYVLTPGGKVFFNPVKVELDGSWDAPVIPKSGLVTGQISFLDGRNARFLVRRFAPTVEDGGVYKGKDWTVVVVQESSVIDETLKIILVAGGGVGVLAILVSLFANYMGIRRGFKHLDAISAEVEELDPSDLSYRFSSLNLPEELEPITSKLNELLEKMEIALEREQRFTSNATHELRTPLAELKAILQYAKGMNDKTNSTESMAQIFSDGDKVVKRMSEMLETLFLLSKHSVQELKLQCPESKMNADIQTFLTSCISLTDEPNRISLEGSKNLGVVVNEAILTSVINNLLSNALAYSKGGVVVTVCNLGLFVSVTIRNEATDLTQEDLIKLREPFWRKQKSRADQNHLGLGLNIVEMFCSSQGWKLSFKLDSNKLHVSVGNIPRP